MSPKDTELNRMNFLAQKRKGFTYRGMLFVLAGWIAFLFFVFCLFLVREAFLKKRVDIIKGSVANFEKQKDQLIKTIETINPGVKNAAAEDNLAAVFTSKILWSDVLRGLVKNLPPQVWLDSVETSDAEGAGLSLKIRGKSKSQRGLTSFVMKLESSGLFNHTHLVELKRAEDAENVLSYEIDTNPVVSK